MRIPKIAVVLPTFISSITAISCSNIVSDKGDNFVIEFNTKISVDGGVSIDNFWNYYTKDQLIWLNKKFPLLVIRITDENSFEYGKTYPTDNIKFLENDIEFTINSKTYKISNLYKNFKFKDPTKINLSNDPEIKSFISFDGKEMSLFNNYDFLFENRYYEYPLTEAILITNNPSMFDIISEIASTALWQSWSAVFPQMIVPAFTRAKSWIKNKEQIMLWEEIIKFRLNFFNFNNLKQISRVKITPMNSIESNVGSVHKNAPIVKIDLLDSNNESLISKNIANKEWIIADNLYENNENNRNNYISRFKDYNSATNFNHSLDINDEEMLFNEYINTYNNDITLLKTKENKIFSQLDSYEKFVNGSLYENATAKGFLWFVKNNADIFYIEVPEFKKNEDKSYELILDKSYIDKNYLNGTYSLIKFMVKVTKSNNEVHYYPWYSIDINSHYHTFFPYKTTNDLRIITNDLFSRNNTMAPNYRVPITKMVDPNEFFNKTLLSLLDLQIYKIKENLSIFDGKIMANYEGHNISKNETFMKFLKSYLGLDVFKYLIGTTNGTTNSKYNLIEDIKLEYLGESESKPGVILLKVDLLDKNKKSMLSIENQNKIIELQGFKGTDWTQINEQITKYKIDNQSLEWLTNNANLNRLTDTNNIIHYFNWKE